MKSDEQKLLFASAQASVHFALSCLEEIDGNLRLKSSFVSPDGHINHWHEFGDLEGPGWGVNSLGGAHLLYRWGKFTHNQPTQEKALKLLDHVLKEGFIDQASGFIYPYFDLGKQSFCLNYTHDNEWLCPGSLARIGCQMLEFSSDLSTDARSSSLREAALGLGHWLADHLMLLPNGWVPRRITQQGNPYPLSPSGSPDPLFEQSADGLFVLQLWAALSNAGLDDFTQRAIALGDAYVQAGGLFGSINHDTYDLHESVAYAVAFRVLNQASKMLDRPAWREFAYRQALTGLDRFRMAEDRHGIPTKNLLWMEQSWNTAYLWENAEASLAYLEAWDESKEHHYLNNGLEILKAIALHHHGELGFLSEGVDWDNHVSPRHHINRALYEDIAYTEPLLNNLHLVAPTLFLFERENLPPVKDLDEPSAIELVNRQSKAARQPFQGRNGIRYLVRFYYPALETDHRLEQALEFTRQSRADGVLLFEASYDMDPAILDLETLKARFQRLKNIVPKFREIVNEVHINVMITLGHVDAGSARPERFAFQFMLDEFGNHSRAAACLLDPAFLEHISDVYRMAAECRTDAVWVDDDTRYLLHDLPGMTCFCPHHLKALLERTGRAWKREEVVRSLRQDTMLRQVWLDLQEESVLSLAELIEKTIHQVDPHQQVGLMSVGQSFHAAEGRRTDRLLRTLSGGTIPMLRPGSGFWHDERPLGVFDKTEACARELSFLGEDVRRVAEIENHPYSPYGKSEQVLALEMGLDVLNGMPDLSLNLLTSMGGSGSLEPEGTDYVSFLNNWRPFLDALARERAGKLRLGIDVTDHMDYARHAQPSRGVLMDWVQPRPWESLLARLGFPICYGGGYPHWIAGEVIHAISDYELAWMLREGCVLDPIAAKGLLERRQPNWGERLGLRAVSVVNDAVNERLVDDPLNGNRAGQILPIYNHISPENLYRFEFTEGKGRVASRWQNVDGQDLGAALSLLECQDHLFSQKFTVRVGLIPYALSNPALALLNIPHRETWGKLMEYVACKPLPCRVIQGINLYPMVFKAPEEQKWLISLANFSADLQEVVKLEMPNLRHQPTQLERLSPNGEWQPSLDLTDEQLQLSIEPFSLAVFRIG